MTAGFGNKLPIFSQGSPGENLSNPVTIAQGGTGATTKAGGFDALSPLTTLGDTLYGGAAGTGTRLAGNTTSVLNLMVQTGTGAASAAPAWSTPLAAGLPTLAASNAFAGANTFGTSTTPVTITQGVATSGSPTALAVTGAAHTTLAAGAEVTAVNFNFAQTIQFATSLPALNRTFRFQAQTLACDTAAQTIANAVTVSISGNPIAGANTTITKGWALAIGTPSTTSIPAGAAMMGVFGAGSAYMIVRDTTNSVEGSWRALSGTVVFGPETAHSLQLQTAGSTRIAIDANGKQAHTFTATTSGVAASILVTPAADTGITASTQSNVWRLNAATRTWATTGTVASQADVLINAMTLASASASQTFTQAGTVVITGAPIAGTNAIITTPYSLWCQAGKAQFDGGAAFGLRADLKSYTVGTLPAAGVAGGMVYVSDAAVAACVAFSNGTNWKRCDNAATTVV